MILFDGRALISTRKCETKQPLRCGKRFVSFQCFGNVLFGSNTGKEEGKELFSNLWSGLGPAVVSGCHCRVVLRSKLSRQNFTVYRTRRKAPRGSFGFIDGPFQNNAKVGIVFIV